MYNSSNDNTIIYGRGILDGRKYFDLDQENKKHGIESAGGVSGITVEGITVSQAGAYFVRLLGTDNNISWVKTIGGWIFNNDGFVGYDRTYIGNCFVWANDDGIKLYRDDQTIENITAWHLTNGGVFQWAWNTSSAKNVSVKNVYLIRGQWPGDGSNQGVFNIRGSSNTNGLQRQTDWIFENIYIDNPVKVLFNLAPKVAHNVDNVIFKNIEAKTTTDVINRINGFNSSYPIKDITIENLKMNGVCINNTNKTSVGKFDLTDSQNVTFDCSVITDIESIQEYSGISVYPNPTKSFVTIQGLSEPLNWELFSVSGNQIKIGLGEKIDLEELNQGIYFLKLNSRIFKIVKE